MKIAVLGAAGRTGRLVVEELLRRGHEVVAVVRDPARAPAGVTPVVGDVREPATLAAALPGCDAVVSALGPSGKETHLHRSLAEALIPAMRAAGVRRYVGVSGAGVDAPGDRKRPRDKVISTLMQTFGGSMVADKAGELAAWRDTDLDWTLVRPPRLVDKPATGRVDADPHVSTRSTSMTRGDLAACLADVVEQQLHVGQAPFVATP